MKIAIFGTGGVGGYFGGLLAQAGHDVRFIARGAHLEEIKKNGLRVNSVNGDFHVIPARATDDPAEIGPVDYVIVAVKHYHLEDVAVKLRPLVGANTTVVPLLNGVDAHEILMKAVGDEALVGGSCSIISYIGSAGVIHQESKLRRVVVGELDGRKSDRVEQLIQALAATGVEAVHAPDIHVALWAKFMVITSFSGVGSLVRRPLGEWRDIPETRALFIDALREVEAVAHARGVSLPDNAVDFAIGVIDNFEAGATASMQRDVAAGNLFELEAFNGTVVRLGEQLGVPTPVHRAIYGLLRPALTR